MYRTCLFCNANLASNDAIESLPTGRRIAFDAERGRLWVVCTECERWNLTPFETRWEAIEQCERLFREERKRITTSHIGLAKLDEGLELVRIGNPLVEEFAAWRYGDQFGRRRRRTITETAVIAAAAASAIAGAVFLGAVVGAGAVAYHFGHTYIARRHAKKVVACIPTVGGETLAVPRDSLGNMKLRSDPTRDHRWKLVLPHAKGSVTLSGDWALNALSMLMPTINGTGGSAQLVQRALKRLEAVQSTDHFLQSAAAMSSHDSRPGALGSIPGLPVDVRLAIEMAVNEQNERYVLEGEMWLLEFAWEQAEFIAHIADNLLVPAEVEEKLGELRHRHQKNDVGRTSRN